MSETGIPLDRIYFIAKTVPCPHCGVRLSVSDLLHQFADAAAAVRCGQCAGAISLLDVGRFVGRLDGVSMDDGTVTQ
jgi:hypothetical protein